MGAVRGAREWGGAMSDIRMGTSPTLGWHFLPENGRLQHDRKALVRVGVTYRVKGPLSLCSRGMHFSVRAIDALKYAPGPICCRVSVSGLIHMDTDKGCAEQRKVLAMVDATPILGEWACWCAEQALLGERKAGREPDARSWAALDVKRRWLRGAASDSEIDAASDAAWAAASDAASAAARDAAWAAASYAASYAARAAQNAELERLLLMAMGLKADEMNAEVGR